MGWGDWFAFLSVASLGPGYDHSSVPDRDPLVIDREGGDFYSQLDAPAAYGGESGHDRNVERIP